MQYKDSGAVLVGLFDQTCVDAVISIIYQDSLLGNIVCTILSAAERRGTPVLLSAMVPDNFGNSPQVAAPRRPHEIDQSTQRCSRLDPSFNRSLQIHMLSCTKQK